MGNKVKDNMLIRKLIIVIRPKIRPNSHVTIAGGRVTSLGDAPSRRMYILILTPSSFVFTLKQ